MIGKNPGWEEIVRYYGSDPTLRPMMKLVEHINVSNHRFRLFGDVFLDDLVLSVRADKDIFSDSLHIRYDKDNQGFVFTNYHGYDTLGRPSWEKKCKIEEAISKFEELILKTKWY